MLKEIIKKLPFDNWGNIYDKPIHNFIEKYKDVILWHNFNRNHFRFKSFKKNYKKEVNSKDKIDIAKTNPQFTEFLSENELKMFLKDMQNNSWNLFHIHFWIKYNKIKNKKILEQINKIVLNNKPNLSLHQKFLFLKTCYEKNIKIPKILLKDLKINQLGILNPPYGTIFEAIHFFIEKLGKKDIWKLIQKLDYIYIAKILDGITISKNKKKKEFIKKYKNELDILKKYCEKKMNKIYIKKV